MRITHLIEKAVVFVIAAVSACSPVNQRSGIDIAAARTVVTRFVSLDSAGDGVGSEASALFLACDARVTDQLEPVWSARVEFVGSLRDSAAFAVTYDVFGRALSRGDPAEVGARDWRFQFKPKVQVDTIKVTADSTGALRIACGPHYGNHPSSETLEWLKERLDAASMVDWARASELASTAGKRLP